jgi:hypothetical protein
MKHYGRITFALFALGFIIRLIFGLTQLERGFLFVSEGDYNLYQIGAEHILAEGDFSNSLFLVRPPLYPIIVALAGDKHALLIVLNCLFGALLIPLTMLAARQLGLKQIVSLLAGLLVAVDPISIKYTAFLGPEALSFLGALAMMNALLALINSANARCAIGFAVLAALALCVSAYARPSIYLIWTGLSVWLLIVRPRYVLAIAVYTLLSFGGIQLWQQHNAQQFNHATFSTVGPYTMTYYRAASVLRLGLDISPDEAYLEINRRMKSALGDDPESATIDDMHSYLAASPEIASALNHISIDIFLDYPLIYITTLGLGIVRYFYLVPYFPPYENLLNPANYIVPVWNIIMILGALYGLYRAARSRHWRLIAVVVLFGGYFSAGTLLVKSAGMTGRESAVIFPVIALASAYGLYDVYQRYRARRIGER